MIQKRIILLSSLSLTLLVNACVAPTSVIKEQVDRPVAIQTVAKPSKTIQKPKVKSVSIHQQIQKSMDPVDKYKMYQALENAREGQTTNWANPTSGNQYTITPLSTIKHGDDNCWQYQVTATVQGLHHKDTAVACRDALGHWQQP